MKSLVFFKRMSLAPGLLILFLGLQAQNDFSGTLANLPSALANLPSTLANLPSTLANLPSTLANLPSTLANTIPHPVTTVIFGALTTLLNRPNR